MQTKVGSLVESLTTLFTGTLVSLLVWTYVVSPIWGFKTTMWDNLAIVTIFTVSSLIRLYIFRRVFDNLKYFRK
jgi:hypothetical protein